MRTGKITRRGLTNSSFSDGAPPVMKCVLYVVLQACALALLCNTLPDQEGDECISGFMSVDRMDALLGNTGRTMDSGNFQGIFPEVSFTCNGSIQRWVLGAKWEGHDEEYIELQIWRPSGDGVYTKVGYTTIIVNGPAALYEYPVSPPLAFQAGDVLGYYQPQPSRSQLRVQLEQEGREPQLGYYYSGPTSPASVLNILPGSVSDDRFQILVNVVTDPPGCGCGFMSVERMRYLLNVDTVSSLIAPSQRQQISPEMRFTCDGNITKWIIGAEYGEDGNLYPELQYGEMLEMKPIGKSTAHSLSYRHQCQVEFMSMRTFLQSQ
ncbi:hypothetical protein GBAR_LOCUS14077 [Geodia barretti]|uniref:Uncharacterized protein n=1 Tax=Geodia barretti TaxID=519541 RepID=A0AA35S6P7_GEOBA|nr:hypothetical protein GBAR_LOCUS14077 [Geodia barretti]